VAKALLLRSKKIVHYICVVEGISFGHQLFEKDSSLCSE